MPTKLFDVGARYVLDDGSVVYTKDAAIEYVRDGGTLDTLTVEYDEDIRRYEKISGKQLRRGRDDGQPGQLPASAHVWNIPPGYENFDIVGLCYEELSSRGINTPAYTDRLRIELDLFTKNQMLPLVVIIKALVDDFRQREVVWGVGRGSSCASLVLYLVGVHRVDPVRYDIELSEFFKELRHGPNEAQENSNDDLE